MTDNRDRQRSKVYAWEDRFVAPWDPSPIKFAQAQGMVNGIWFGGRWVCAFHPTSSRFPSRPAPR